MSNEKLLTIKETAEKLEVHARTARKWIENFEDYVKPKLNAKGHYVISKNGLEQLTIIKDKMQAPNATMKKVHKELAADLAAALNKKAAKEKPVTSNDKINEKIESLTQAVEKISLDLSDRMERVEDHIYNLFDFIEDMEDKLISINKDSVSSEEIQNMFTEIRSKQDQLRVELRSVNFTHRLTSSNEKFLPKRAKKNRFLGIF